MTVVPALSIRGVSKTFVGQPALQDVDMDLLPGEIRAVVGQNGCGKSTLIKVLAGFHEADPGARVEVDGSVVHVGTPGAAEAAGLRFVHQDLGLVLTLDTIDNLAMGHGYDTGRSHLIRWRNERERARAAMRRLGYDVDVRVPLGQLAVSERTAVAVARALSERRTPPKVLVLDEPTANLPADEARRLFALVRQVSDAGVAVLFVSHHLDEVFGLCDSVTVLRDGRHVATRPAADLDEAALVELMIGRSLGSYDQPARGPGKPGEVRIELAGVGAGVLRDVDLQVRAGEVVGVAGITGSGREEFAAALFGGTARSGRVVIDGSSLPPERPDLSVAAGLALVPADRHANAAFLESPLRENVSVVNPGAFARWGLISQRRERADVQQWLDRLQVKPALPERAMATLSGGNQQKVVLSRWLSQKPLVLVLDEPTQGVDVAAKAEIHALVDAAALGGAAVIVVSTDNVELARLCERVVVLRGGRLAGELHRPHLDADRITAATLQASAPSRPGLAAHDPADLQAVTA